MAVLQLVTGVQWLELGMAHGSWHRDQDTYASFLRIEVVLQIETAALSSLYMRCRACSSKRKALLRRVTPRSKSAPKERPSKHNKERDLRSLLSGGSAGVGESNQSDGCSDEETNEDLGLDDADLSSDDDEVPNVSKTRRYKYSEAQTRHIDYVKKSIDDCKYEKGSIHCCSIHCCVESLFFRFVVVSVHCCIDLLLPELIVA